MQAYRIEAMVEPDGSVTVRCLPFPAGGRVEVIVLPATPAENSESVYPLRGTAYRYDAPTEPVAEADWDAAR